MLHKRGNFRERGAREHGGPTVASGSIVGAAWGLLLLTGAMRRTPARGVEGVSA